MGKFAESGRGHWSIASLHSILGVVYHEDGSRVRTGHARVKSSCLRNYITGLLKVDTLKRILEQKRKRAGWNIDYLKRLLRFA